MPALRRSLTRIRRRRVLVGILTTLFVVCSSTTGTAKPKPKTKPKIVPQRVQLTAKVDYTATVSAHASDGPTNAKVDVDGQLHFVATTEMLMETYNDPFTKRREYRGIVSKGLKTERTTGTVTASYNATTKADDLDSYARFSLTSAAPEFFVDINGKAIVGTRDITLQMGADLAGSSDALSTSEKYGTAQVGLFEFSELMGVGAPDESKKSRAQVSSFFCQKEVCVFGLPPNGKPNDQLGQDVLGLLEKSPWLGFYGCDIDERAGHFLQVRFDQTHTLPGEGAKPFVTEHLMLTIDIGSPTFRPFK